MPYSKPYVKAHFLFAQNTLTGSIHPLVDINHLNKISYNQKNAKPLVNKKKAISPLFQGNIPFHPPKTL